jgi:parvulin-like peptidyl-prolyl isomerase
MIKVLFGIIIIVFIFWGVGSFRDSDRTVAEIGPYKVSVAEYHQAYDKTITYYRTLYRDKFDENMMRELKLKERVMDQLVDKYLLLKKAEEMGIRISDREFSEYVAGIEAFKRNGKFDEQVYAEVLKRNNMDPKSFEEAERQALVIGKLMNIIQDNGSRTDEKAARNSYIKETGQIKLSMAVIDPSDYRDKVSVEEKELNDIYEREKSLHKSENTYHLKYMIIEEKSSVKDDQAYMELLKSRDISAYSKTKGVEVVDLGTARESEVFARFSRVKIQESLKGMVKGDISLPVRDGNRSYIFQIIDRQDGKPLERAEALQVIKARIISEKAKTMARAKAEDSIKDKGTKFSKETAFLSRNVGVVPGVGQVPKGDLGIFALNKGQTYEKPVEIADKYYLFTCSDEKVPGNEQWEKDKEIYKQIFAMKVREEFITAFKEDLKKQIKVKVDWKEI